MGVHMDRLPTTGHVSQEPLDVSKYALPDIAKKELSQPNREILKDHLVKKCGSAFSEATAKAAQPSMLETLIAAVLPSSRTAGRGVGYAIAVTHGAEVSNGLISYVADRLLPEKIDKPKTWGETIFNGFVQTANPTIEETAKLMLTPKLLPLVTVFSQGAGGLLLPAAVSLVTMLVNKLLSDPNSKFTPDNLPPFDQLLKYKDGEYFDANGEKLSRQDMKDLSQSVVRYNLVCELLTANREDVSPILSRYIKDTVTEDGKLQAVYADGTKVSEKEVKHIEEAFDRLRGVNPDLRSVWKAITLLADHVPIKPPEEQLADLQSDFVHMALPDRLKDENKT